MRVRAASVAVLSLVAFGLSSASASAQDNYEVLRSLIEPAYPPKGRLLEASDGRLYGVAVVAGPSGKGALLAYDRQPNGSLTSTVIHAFSGPDGATPLGGVIQGSDGALYGTTAEGGPAGGGTVYRVATDGAFTLLHAFSNAGGPCWPATELVERADGFLYGTTIGGCGGDQTIFRVSKAGAFALLHTFQLPDAFDPIEPLIDGGDGKLYGITTRGTVLLGETIVGAGTLYSITPLGVFTVLHTFASPGPELPTTLIDGRDGFFYATNVTSNESTAFMRLSRTGDVSVILNRPRPVFGNGLNQINWLRGHDDNFYGASTGGGDNGRGAVFRLTPGGTFTVLHSFTDISGANSLMQTSNGALYGGTESGGVNRRGVIFRTSINGGYAVVQSFTGADPLLPLAPLLEGPDGTLYGTSCLGGIYNAGTIFKVAGPASTLTVMHSFAYWDGACPRGTITFGHDGAIYGTASASGIWGRGTIFRITTSGSFTPVFFFNSTTGSTPHGGLLFASDGNYYGTTYFGIGAAWAGTLFRATPSGTFTTLHVFDRTSGFSPAVVLSAPLIQASDGHIYGATLGRPFRATLAGVVTDLDYSALVLRGPLAEAPDGSLYGTAGNADPRYPGSIFRVTPAGTGTDVHTFTGPDGSVPFAGLRLAPDGWFYGATAFGGTNDHGTLFQFSGAGAPVTVHEFSGADGSLPFATLTLRSDGALYGSTVSGGVGDRGVIFRLRRP